MADAIPTLSISTEKICFVVLKAREFDVKDADTSSDEDGSNPADDRMVEVLENRPDDPVDQELVAFIEAVSEDEDLFTLTWLGRGDGGLEDWDDLRAEAARVHNRRTASYLLGIPLLPDFLSSSRRSAVRAKSLKRTACEIRQGPTIIPPLPTSRSSSAQDSAGCWQAISR